MIERPVSVVRGHEGWELHDADGKFISDGLRADDAREIAEALAPPSDVAPGVSVVSPTRLTYLDSLASAYSRHPTQQRSAELAHAVPDLIAAIRACWAEDGRRLSKVHRLRRLLHEARPLVDKHLERLGEYGGSDARPEIAAGEELCARIDAEIGGGGE